MHEPVVNDFGAIAARLKEIEQGKQREREKPAEPETPAAVVVPDSAVDENAWYDGH